VITLRTNPTRRKKSCFFSLQRVARCDGWPTPASCKTKGEIGGLSTYLALGIEREEYLQRQDGSGGRYPTGDDEVEEEGRGEDAEATSRWKGKEMMRWTSSHSRISGKPRGKK
jgi:hypothetical protein